MTFLRDRRLQYFRAAVNVNSVGDSWTFNGLPAAYRVQAFYTLNPSTSLGASLATLGLYTGAGGTGTAVVTAALLTTLTAAGADPVSAALASNARRTEATLYAYNAVAHGSAATVDVVLEILDLGT